MKEQIRRALGPPPVFWYLLPDGRVTRPCIALPTDIHAQTYRYEPKMERLTRMGVINFRYKPLGYLSMKIESETVGSLDISDWVGDLRANHTDPPPLQIIQLWSLVHEKYVPIRNITISWTDSAGETQSQRID